MLSHELCQAFLGRAYVDLGVVRRCLTAAFNLIFRRSWRTASTLNVGIALVVFAVCTAWISAVPMSDVAITLALSFCSAYLLDAAVGLVWRRLRGEPLRLK